VLAELPLRELELLVLDVVLEVVVDVVLEVVVDDVVVAPAEVDAMEVALVVRLDWLDVEDDEVAGPFETAKPLEAPVGALPEPLERLGALLDVERPEVAVEAPTLPCEPSGPLGPTPAPPLDSWSPVASPGPPHPATTAQSNTHADELRIPMQGDQKPIGGRAAQ
jgi:hypothetical protein